MSFMSSFKKGRDGAPPGRGGVPPVPRGNPPPGTPRDDPPEDDGPSPIKLGYRCEGEDKPVGEPILYKGERHVVLFGLNGAGKSTRFLIENLMTLRGRSLFVFDIKGELAVQTSEERRRYGDVKIINPYGVLGLPSDGFNPLAQLDAGSTRLYDAAAAMADALIEIEFWLRAILVGVCPRPACRAAHVGGDRGAARRARAVTVQRAAVVDRSR